MKKNFKLMTALASAALLLTACSSDKLEATSSTVNNPQAADNAIQFGTYVGNKAVTRAATLTDATYSAGPIANAEDTNNGVKSLAQARFGVFSYLTQTDYDPANVGITPSNIAPNFMYDQEIKYSTANPTNMWIYDPVKYWPNGIDSQNSNDSPSNTAENPTADTYAKKLSFFAYAPFMAKSSFNTAGTGTAGTQYPTAIGDNTNFKSIASATNGIVAMTTNAFTGNVWLKYMMPKANETEAVDLLWGTRGTTNYEKAGSDDDDNKTIGDDYNLNLTKQTVDERVKFLFKHALAKVGGSTATTTPNDLTKPSAKCGFQVMVDVDGNNGDNQDSYFENGFDKAQTLVTVKEVKIMDGGTANTYTSTTTTNDIYNSGWFNIETGNWDMTGATTTGTIDITVQNNTSNDNALTHTYTINPKIRENSANPAVKNATGVNWNPSEASNTADGYTGGAEGVEATPKPLFADEYVPALMFIPGAAAQTIYVMVDYIVRTADANLKDGFTKVEQIVLNKVTLPTTVLAPNKIYNIIMHLGLTSVKFEAKVSDWQKKSGSSLDTDGNETGGSSDNEESIWLPSNVVTQTVVANADATAGNTSVALTGLNGSALRVLDQDNTVVTGASSLDITSGSATIQVACNANAGVTKRNGWIKLSDGYQTITINVTQDATTLSVSAASIAVGDTEAVITINTPVGDLTSYAIDVTATKNGSSIELSNITPSFDDSKTKVNVTLPAAASSDSYVFTVTVADATGTTDSVVVPAP